MATPRPYRRPAGRRRGRFRLQRGPRHALAGDARASTRSAQGESLPLASRSSATSSRTRWVRSCTRWASPRSRTLACGRSSKVTLAPIPRPRAAPWTVAGASPTPPPLDRRTGDADSPLRDRPGPCPQGRMRRRSVNSRTYRPPAEWPTAMKGPPDVRGAKCFIQIARDRCAVPGAGQGSLKPCPARS